MPVLLSLTTTACVSKPAAQKEIILPPKPERSEWDTPQNLQEVALYVNYLETQVRLWENWGERVTNMIEKGVTEP